MEFKKIKSVVYFDNESLVFIENNDEFYQAALAYQAPVIYVGDTHPITCSPFINDYSCEILENIYNEEDYEINEYLVKLLEKHFENDILEYIDCLTYEDIYNFNQTLIDESYTKIKEVTDYYFEYEAFIKNGFVHCTPKDSNYMRMKKQYEEYCLENVIKELEYNMTPFKKKEIIKQLKRKYK